MTLERSRTRGDLCKRLSQPSSQMSNQMVDQWTNLPRKDLKFSINRVFKLVRDKINRDMRLNKCSRIRNNLTLTDLNWTKDLSRWPQVLMVLAEGAKSTFKNGTVANRETQEISSMRDKEINFPSSQTALWMIEDQDLLEDKQMVQSQILSAARDPSSTQLLIQGNRSLEDKLSLGHQTLIWTRPSKILPRNPRLLISEPQPQNLVGNHQEPRELPEFKSQSPSVFWRWNLMESTQKKSKSMLTKIQETLLHNSVKSSTWVTTPWTDCWAKLLPSLMANELI